MSKRLSLLLLVLGLTFNFSLGQTVVGDSLFIHVEKAGKITSILKKCKADVKKVCVTGVVNDKDLLSLSQMGNIELLDFSDCVYKGTLYREWDGSKYCVICKLPKFGNLKNLYTFKTGVVGKESVPLVVIETKQQLKYVETYPNIIISNGGILSSHNFIEEGLIKPTTVDYKDCMKTWKYRDNSYYEFHPYILHGTDSIQQKLTSSTQRLTHSTIYHNVNTDEILFNGSWHDGIDEKWLSRITYIGRGDFEEYSKPILSLPAVKYAMSLDLNDSTTEIRLNSIEEFSMNSIDSKIKSITFPASLKRLVWGYNHINEITFLGNTPPILERFEVKDERQDVVFFVPDNAKKKYKSAKSWEGIYVKEVNGGGLTIDKDKTYNIKVENPGTILSYLPVEKLEEIESLTITGMLYETDIMVINKCKRLIHLDLSNAFICSSPEKLNNEAKSKEQLAGLAALIGGMADVQSQEISATDYLSAQVLSTLLQEAANVQSSNDACIIPSGSFSGLKWLETIIFPVRCSKIYSNVCHGCIELKNVTLPPFLKSISDNVFRGCINLEKLNFPETLTYCGSSFYGTNINVIDFSKCHFNNNWRGRVELSFHPLNMKELRLPQGVETVCVSGEGNLYVPSDVKVIRDWQGKKCNEYHFESPTPPEMEYKPQNCTIYIPKGSTTAYFAKFGETNKYIEE